MFMPLYILNLVLTAFVTFLFLLVVSIFPTSTEATTTFTGSTIESVDQGHQTITIHTRDGQSWTLSVDNPDLITKEHITKGDQVSIEVDPTSDKVTKIIRLADQTQAETRPEQAQPTQ